MLRTAIAALPLLLALCVSGCESGVCGAAQLTTALGAAQAGDVVYVGACEIEGSFVVPGGVTLEGGPASVLRSVDGAAPVLSIGGPGASIVGLTVRVDHGGVGVRAASECTLDHVNIQVSRGIGVGLDAAGATLRDVDLEGMITADNADFASLDPAETSAYGLVGRALGTSSVSLERLHASGFSVAAVSLAGGNISWVGAALGPDLESNRGVGAAFFGSTVTASSVEIDTMLSGVGLPGVGLAVTSPPDGTASLDAIDLRIADGDGYGLFSDGAQVTLHESHFESMGSAGIRLQGGSLFADNLTCLRNGGAGVLAIDTISVSIHGGELGEQHEAMLASTLGRVLIGDGIEVARDPMTIAPPPLDLELVDVVLENNERAGLVIDAADGTVNRLLLQAVSTSGTGGGLGAIVSRTTVPPDWDRMVSRDAVTAANDGTFSGTVDVVGIMMPPGLVATPPGF